MQAVSICFAIDHVDGDHTIDKPRNYDFWRAYQPHFWGGPLLGFKAPNPRTLEIIERSFTPNPDDDPLLVDADQRKSGGDQQPVDLPAHRGAAQLRAGRLRLATSAW